MSAVKVHPNVIKMRESHIPPTTYSTTLKRENQTFLSAQIENETYIVGDGLRSFYLHANDTHKATMRRVVLIAGLMAKELRLKGQPVVHVNLAGFLREIRFEEMEREQRRFNPVMDRIGTGYIVIPDFLEYQDLEQKYGYHALQVAADYLSEHVNDGGGLVLGAANIDVRDAHQFGSGFCTILNDRFTTHAIHAA